MPSAREIALSADAFVRDYQARLGLVRSYPHPFGFLPLRETFLNFSPPSIGSDEIAEVVDTLKSDWITTGPKTKRFESEFCTFLDSRAALAVSSATDAMQVALAAIGLRPRDEVLTTVMTFCSTAHVIEHLNARPVFIDVQPDTLCIDPELAARAVTDRTRGILPVHLYGHPCEMDTLLDLAQAQRLFIIEDAAHALPARYKGRNIGTIGDATAFSFYATKNLTTAEGGMLTGSPEFMDEARKWSLHGMSGDAYKRYSAGGSWYYEVVLPGFKCNMTDIQAAMGLHQLKKLPAFQARRREIVKTYNEAFSNNAALQVPVERTDVESAWHIYALRLNLSALKISRNDFIRELTRRKIGTSVHFIPLHLHPYYRDKYGLERNDFPVATSNYERLISLPLHPRLSEEDVNDVVEAVLDVIRRNER